MRSLVQRVELPLPLDHYVEAFPRGAGTFLLDGGVDGRPGDARSAASMLGAEPILELRAWRSHRTADGTRSARIEVTGPGRDRVGTEGDPFEKLRSLVREHHVVFDERPLPLMAGAVGFVGYECGQLLEAMPCEPRPNLGLPDLYFGFYRWVLGRTTEGTFLSVASDDPEATRNGVLAKLRALSERRPVRSASVPEDLDAYEALAARLGVKRSLARDAYLDRIGTAKDHIAAGDAYEICLTHAVETSFTGDPLTLFRTLKRASPAPYAAFLDLPEASIVSSSPERFVALDADGTAESRPIKGTRPRGRSTEEDRALAHDLAENEKDRAENTMIVDLVRNDLGRVCAWGTVEVPALGVVEPYATVHQLVSTIRGKLAPDRDAVDLLQACFPPGSMTGAPKIEAVRILEGLEPVERGVYAGALGWLDFDGTMDTSVVIRTIVVKDGKAFFHVGGAIVADSEAHAEHDETLHKARALVASIDAAS